MRLSVSIARSAARLVLANVRQAVRELGAESDVDVEFVDDSKKMELYGVNQTPAVVLLRYQLKSQKLVPEVSVIKEWIKDL
ncbi:MAG: thioredoxin family protein [Kiritimatiellia bacterium]|nr:thioredoxin family protein [Lentisphaerota bacterium]